MIHTSAVTVCTAHAFEAERFNPHRNAIHET